MLPHPVVDAVDTVWRDGVVRAATRAIPEETAVAITYDGATHAVMMATPTDLEDFAVGFSLAEGVVAGPHEILEVEAVAAAPLGIDLRLALAEGPTERLWRRRRAMAGPVGCGLCGLDSLEQALRRVPQVPRGHRVPAAAIVAAMHALPALQTMNGRTRAMHAAAFWTEAEGVLAVREDVGRHNALDKLCGAMAREAVGMGDGVVLLTSRVSIEMVQKVAIAGCPMLVAVSAPTALAVAAAEGAGITLIAIARGDGFEVFTHPWRIAFIGTGCAAAFPAGDAYLGSMAGSIPAP